MIFTITKLEIIMTLFWKKLTKNAPSALFSTKVQKFVTILRTYNCLKLLFMLPSQNIVISFYFLLFNRTCIDSSFLLKTDAAILYELFFCLKYYLNL